MAVGFKIADGYVEVHAKVDRNSVRNAARQAANDVDKEGQKRKGSFLKWLFTPNPDLMQALSRPIAKIFSTPVLLGIASAGVFAVADLLATALVGALLSGLAVGFIALGALALQENKRVQDALSKTGDRVWKSLERAATPMLEPLIRGITLLADWVERMEPMLNKIFAAVGPMIEPLVNAFGGMLNNMLPGILRAMPGIQAVIDAMAVHMPGLGTAIGDFFATIADNEELLTRAIGLMFTWLDIMFKIAGPILVWFMAHFVMMADAWNALWGAIKVATGFVTGTLVPAWMKWQDIMFAIVSFIPGLLVTLGGKIKDFAVGSWNWITSTFGKAGGFFSELWGSITNGVTTAFTTVVGFFTALPGQIWGALQALPGVMTSAFWAAFDAVFYAIGFAIGSWINYLMNVPGMVGSAFTAIWDAGVQATAIALAFLWTVVTGAWNKIWTFITAIPPTIATAFTALWLGAKNATVAAWNFLTQTVPQKGQQILNWLFGLPPKVSSVFTDAWNRARNATTSKLNDLVGFVRAAPGKIVGALGNTGQMLYSAGRDIIRGLMNGITSMVQSAIDTVVRALSRIVEGAKDALGIGSPSKVFAEQVGRWIPEGVRVGVQQNASAPQQAIEDLVNPLTIAPQAAGGGTVTNNTSGPTYVQNNISLNANNLGELQQVLDFLNGKLQQSSKAWEWAGNIYESQGAFQRGHA